MIHQFNFEDPDLEDRHGFEECQPIRVDDDGKMFKVPIYALNGKYTVSVGSNWWVIFESHELPADIRSKLGMVFCAPMHDEAGKRKPTKGYYSILAHSNTYPTEYSTIGWRVSKGIYIVVVSVEVLELMRFSRVSRLTEDTES
jgi:hypothetical protein